MIEIKELRIGNKVSYVGCVSTVNGLFLSHFTVYDNNMIQRNSAQDNIQPLIITPEILQACGFAEDNDPYVMKWFNEDIGYIARCEGGFTFPDSDGEPSIGYAMISLHQLQNYYFAIMGKELEVNLTAKTVPA